MVVGGEAGANFGAFGVEILVLRDGVMDEMLASSISVSASSSVVVGSLFSSVKRRRGLSEERVRGPRRVDDKLLRMSCSSTGSLSSSTNLRNIFLPRL